jgi:hypothetical protein
MGRSELAGNGMPTDAVSLHLAPYNGRVDRFRTCSSTTVSPLAGTTGGRKERVTCSLAGRIVT